MTHFLFAELLILNPPAAQASLFKRGSAFDAVGLEKNFEAAAQAGEVVHAVFVPRLGAFHLAIRQNLIEHFIVGIKIPTPFA